MRSEQVEPDGWPQAIADTEGPQLVVAGPGTGKTEFLVAAVGPITIFTIGLICIAIARSLGWSFDDGRTGVAGAILLSGVYAAQHPNYNAAKPAPNQIAYYGEDTAKWRDMSPLHHVETGHPPTYITVAEYDPYPLAWPSVALASELVKCDKVVPWFRMLAGHNHVSPALQINSEVDDLGRDLLGFVAACTTNR